MNPYKKYTELEYDKLSEQEMLNTLDGVYSVADACGSNEEMHAIVMGITMSALKNRYKLVCDRLRKIYPLSFPEIELHYPNPVPTKLKTTDELAPPAPIYPNTEEEKKSLEDCNKLIESFRKKVI